MKKNKSINFPNVAAENLQLNTMNKSKQDFEVVLYSIVIISSAV